MVNPARRLIRGSIVAKVLTLATILLLLLVGISIYALEESRNTLRDSIMEDVKLEARSTMDRIDGEIFSRLHELSMAAVDPYLIEVVETSNSEFEAMDDREEYITQTDVEWISTPPDELTALMTSIMNNTTSLEFQERYIEHYREDHGVDAWGRISVMNKYGAVIAMTSRPNDYRQSDEDWWQMTMQQEDNVADVAYDSYSGFYAQRISVMVHDFNGTFAGEVMGFANTIDIARLAVTGGRLYESTRVALTDEGGALIFSSDAYIVHANCSEQSYFILASSDEESFIAEVMDRQVLYGYARSEGYLSYEGLDWRIFIGYDLQEIFAPADNLLTRIALMASAAFVCGVLLALVLSRTITKPITEFKRAAKQISDGRMGTRVPIMSSDEVGDLAGTFNIMVDRLERSYEGLEDKVKQRTLELAKLNENLTDEVAGRKRYSEALELANKKLRFLGHLTRHDIKNQLTVMRGWLSMARDEPNKEVLAEMMSKTDKGARTIDALLDFTGEYEKVGLTEPVWLEVPRLFKEGVMGLDTQKLTVSLDLDGLEIFGDPMFSKVFRNLVDNTLRHGQKVTRISVSHEVRPDGLAIVYEDDGIGIENEARAKLFQRGYGKNTGLGLYLTKEILDTSGMIIRETGVPGRGVRFEMLVPSGKFRFQPVRSA